MASPQTVWGIDVGRCALKAVKLAGGGDDKKVEILAHEYIEHSKILTQPDADRPELIRIALETFLSHNDLSKDTVVVSVPGQHTLARFTKLPPVAHKRIPDIVRYEADQQIPFDMDEVIWDYQTFQEEGSPDLEVGIFAMKRELIREHLLHFEQVSIEPVAVQSSPLAVYNAAHFDGIVGDETSILLDIGAENTDLIIATKETFWTRTVPIGGNNFTQALVKSFKLSFSKAESLKRSAEASKYARQIFQAMRPVFADLVQELQRSIGFYSSTHRDTKIAKIVCLGNAFKLPGLQKYLQQNLSLPVEKIESFKKLSIGTDAASSAFRNEILSFAVAYGLAVQALDQGKVSSNLLPTELAKQAVWRRKRPAFAAAAACLLLAGGLIWFRKTADMSALAAGAEDRIPPITDVDRAMQIVNNGPSGTLSDRAQAQAILAAGDFLKRELSHLSGQGDREQRDTQTLLLIQQNKAVIPRIFQAVHDAVPRPPAPLEEATESDQYVKAIESAQIPRALREEITIQSLHMHFDPDVNLIVWESLTPVPDPINDPEETLPAVKLEITCRTSFQGDPGGKYKTATEFVSRSFMDALRQKGRQPGMGFYFDRVYLNFGGRVESSSVGASALRGGSAGGRSSGRFGRGPSAISSPTISTVVDAKSLDPVTHEKMSDDWEFEIWVDAVLEDYPGDDEGEGDGD